VEASPPAVPAAPSELPDPTDPEASVVVPVIIPLGGGPEAPASPGVGTRPSVAPAAPAEPPSPVPATNTLTERP
ncbi:MAG: hypothetical protein M3O46_10830, partial [Myxococcota bacterium]|nr:hypothetical protein [Myxococcota bacterium]